MFSSALRKAVMPVINKRIEEAETSLDETLVGINNDTSSAISAIVEAGNARKEVALENAIDLVLN